MPRPRRDGLPPSKPVKTKLTELFVRKLEPKQSRFLVYDTLQRGLALQIEPTGFKTWKCIYSIKGRARWLTIGSTSSIGLGEARALASECMYRVVKGEDPCADKAAACKTSTFREIARRYVEEYAKQRNRSWEQASYLVETHLVPRWGDLAITDIARQDAKAAFASINSRSVANQTIAAASAIFSWAIREEIVAVNPCALIEQHPTKSRERVLSEVELNLFWSAFDVLDPVIGAALKTLLLTGQRPGEVKHMRREHIIDGWWELPGSPAKELNWPGTKNGESHRVWLPKEVLELLGRAPEQRQPFANIDLALAMRAICADINRRRAEHGDAPMQKATPHDLRRTHGTTITALGFGRAAMDRIQNHKAGGVGAVYDRYSYAEESKQIMEAVAARIVTLATAGHPTTAEPPNILRGQAPKAAEPHQGQSEGFRPI